LHVPEHECVWLAGMPEEDGPQKRALSQEWNIQECPPGTALPQEALNHRLVGITLPIPMQVKQLAGAIYQTLSGKAIDEWANGRKRNVGRKALGRRHNGVPLVLTDAQKCPLLRTRHQG